MLAFRLIARLDIRGPHCIKTIRCEGVRKVGDPYEIAARYEGMGIDEIIYLDTVASLYGRNGLHDLLARATDSLATPITAGGGVRSVADARALLLAGADKIAVNSAAIRRPELITELAEKFGSQAVVVQIDAKRKGDGWEAYCDGGRQATGIDAVAWAEKAVDRGAGECLCTSIDQEGTRRGPDLRLMDRVVRLVPVPVVAAGGVGTVADVVAAGRSGVLGLAMAAALHSSLFDLNEARRALAAAGVPVRMAA